MSKVLIIGAGGVGNVVAHKCAMNSAIFTDIMLASRTVSKCEKIAADIKEMHGVTIKTAAVDADNVPGDRDQCGPSLPGPDHYGRVPGNRRPLFGYRQL